MGMQHSEAGNGQEALACFREDEAHLRDGKFGLTHTRGNVVSNVDEVQISYR